MSNFLLRFPQSISANHEAGERGEETMRGGGLIYIKFIIHSFIYSLINHKTKNALRSRCHSESKSLTTITNDDIDE